MASVYIEARQRFSPGAVPFDEYTVEDYEDSQLARFSTQADAIEWAKVNGYYVLVPYLPHLTDKRVAGHWRPA
jgi:hypothetical protein